MRFKPPPANSPIGWRVEFRPTEVLDTNTSHDPFFVSLIHPVVFCSRGHTIGVMHVLRLHDHTICSSGLISSSFLVFSRLILFLRYLSQDVFLFLLQVQLTDFENAAFATFVVLITRVILSFNLNLLIPLSKVTTRHLLQCFLYELPFSMHGIFLCCRWMRTWLLHRNGTL